MSVSTAEQKQFLDRIVELAKFRADGIAKWWQDADYGLHDPNDAQFRMWFEGQMQMQGPDWLRCLTGTKQDGTPMVEGGGAAVKRYQRVIAGGQMKANKLGGLI